MSDGPASVPLGSEASREEQSDRLAELADRDELLGMSREDRAAGRAAQQAHDTAVLTARADEYENDRASDPTHDRPSWWRDHK